MVWCCYCSYEEAWTKICSIPAGSKIILHEGRIIASEYSNEPYRKSIQDYAVTTGFLLRVSSCLKVPRKFLIKQGLPSTPTPMPMQYEVKWLITFKPRCCIFLQTGRFGQSSREGRKRPHVEETRVNCCSQLTIYILSCFLFLVCDLLAHLGCVLLGIFQKGHESRFSVRRDSLSKYWLFGLSK